MRTPSYSIEVIYEDDDLLAINKPHGLLVHRTKLAKDATEFALQLVRDYVGGHVYPAHRLDRKTSGALLFTKSPQANAMAQSLFRKGEVSKRYKAIVRGYTDDDGIIDYPLVNEGKSQEAITTYSTDHRYELDLPFGQYDTSRYSLITLTPSTGRFHQLRKHMAHIFHPIIGDRPHGCNKQNKLWKEQFGMSTMMLHSESISLEWINHKYINITAPKSDAFQKALTHLSNMSTKKLE